MKNKFEIMKSYYNGTITDKEIKYYKDNYMDDFEKEIGVPFFLMNTEQQLRYDMLCYNNETGSLTGYDCPICKNKGSIMFIKDGYKFYRDCKCLVIRQTLENMKNSGLGNLLNIYKFDNYKQNDEWQKTVFKQAKDFISSDNNWFAMFGVSGSGKTHICTAISGELLKSGMKLQYMMWLDKSTYLKQVVTDKQLYQSEIEKLKNVQVLYIDDFLKNDNDTKPSSADIKLANEILNYRYNKARMDKSKRYITIISSERTIEQIMEYDMALAGRIIEMTKPNNLIVLTGIEKNFRLK